MLISYGHKAEKFTLFHAHKIATSMAVLLVLPILVRAQIRESKLLAGDADSLHLFGEAVAVSGDAAVVGARGNYAAYIFAATDAGWTEQAKLMPEDSLENAFGFCVAIDSDYALVGAPVDDDAGEDAGAAYVFKRGLGNWDRMAKLTAADAVPGDEFGIAVALQNGVAVVGAHRQDQGGFDAGAAYIFVLKDDTWRQTAKLVAADGAPEDRFGISVDLDSATVTVGAWLADDNGVRSGSAYVFTREGSEWRQEAKLLASDGAVEDRFGYSVGVSGEHAIVGALGAGNIGAAYIFRRAPTGWVETTKLIARDFKFGSFFGQTVAMENDVAVVGAWNADGAVPAAGAAYVFARRGDNWLQRFKLTASDGVADDFFGFSAAISGNSLIVGAQGVDQGAFLGGAAYVYTGEFGFSKDNEEVPTAFHLFQNYPNPFNATTKIRYDLSESGPVEITVYNWLGQKVKRLVSATQPAGAYEVAWNSLDEEGLPAASGVYVYQLKAGVFSATKKSILLR